jgi:hypothetical protein
VPVGIAAAVAYAEDKEVRYSERPLGKTVSLFDTDLAALDTGISLAQTLLVNCPATHILVLTSNASAIEAILKPGPHSSHSTGP